MTAAPDLVARVVLQFARRTATRPLLRHASAPLAAGLVTSVQYALFSDPGIAPFNLYYLAVGLSAGLFGLGPGLVCAGLSAILANAFFIAPYRDWSTSGSALAASALFLVGGPLIALICSSLRASLLRMEVATRELEHRGDLLRLAHDAVLVWRFDGAIEFWNEGAERLYGFSGEEALGRMPHQLLQTEFPRPWSEIGASLRAGRRWEGELTHRTSDGRAIVVSSSIQLVKGADGLERVLEANRDITERKQAERRLRGIYDLGLIGVLYWTADGRILDANDTFLQMVGYTRDDLGAGRVDWARMTPPEWRHVDERALEDFRSKGVSPPFEKEYIRRDGRRIPILVGGAMLDGSRTEGIAFVVDISERKAAEDSLRQSEDRLARSQQIAHLGSWELDLRTNRLYWSDEVYRIFGLEPQQLAATYEGFLEAVHPDDRAAVDLAYSGSLRDGRDGYEIEHRVVRRSTGEVRFVHEKCQHQRDASGRVVKSVGMVHDVTELREALRQAEERTRLLEAMMEHIPLGITIADAPDVTIRQVSRYGRELIEGSREEPTGAPAAQDPVAWQFYRADGVTLANPDELPLTRATRQGELVQEEEWVVSRKDGAKIPILCTAAPIRGRNGDIRGGVIGWQDITERKRSEAAMLRSREGFRRLAEASLSVMSRTDLEGMLQATSEAALALTDARMATCGHGFVGGRYVVGGSARVPGAPPCPPADMFQLDRGGVHLALLERAGALRLTDAELRRHPQWWGLPEGHVPMRGLLGVPMVTRGGAANGVILVTDREGGDFTEEDEWLLKQLATVASLALQHIEARVSLEEADRRKSEFLGMLSHELRNPLAAIRNGLYVLGRAEPGGAQAARAKAVVERQTEQLTRLTDDLLDLTRISSGKIRLEPERLELNTLVRSTVEDHRQQFDGVGVELEVLNTDEPLPVSVDPTRMKQVIGNLLHNAAKFTPRGGRTTVSLRRGDDEHALLTVRDTGVGIKAELLSRVFEPFVQSDHTLDRSIGGLGLGLALVKGLVEQHRGQVSVHSDGVDKGATFLLRLPLERRRTPRLGVAPETRERSARRILLIEDNRDAATSMREALELNEHVVEVAYTGFEGIEKARAFRPDVILCDIGLPGMDGYQVARAFRSDPALQGVALFALSGYAQPEDLERSRDAGFDLHLAKPVELDELEARLSRGAGASATAG